MSENKLLEQYRVVSSVPFVILIYMNTTNMIILLLALGGLAFFLFANQATAPHESNIKTDDAKLSVTPISHASFILNWEDIIIFNDPVGEIELYAKSGEPKIILLSDIHEDHFSVETLSGLAGSSTLIVAPPALYKLLPKELAAQTTVMSNGDIHTIGDITITAIPMYNLPESPEAYHVKGRGNGYLLESGETRVYIAGDTTDTPEMRALTDIDIAFIPMNLPYTMDVDTAAAAVLGFAPKVVYPYHYRNKDGLSDINEFARLVKNGNSDIEVKLLDWYSGGEEVKE